MKRITIVRHGNTFAADELPRRIGRRTDLPLVASGIAQGEALGRWFCRDGTRFDRVLVSPLRRTRDTAGIILRDVEGAAVPEPVDWLAEIDHGPDEDQPEAAIVTRIGSEALHRWDAQGIAPPGWQVDAAARVAGWRALLDSDWSGHVLAVTSNGAARFALMASGLIEGADALPSLKLRTGAWGMIEVRDAEPARLLAWDRRPPPVAGEAG